MHSLCRCLGAAATAAAVAACIAVVPAAAAEPPAVVVVVDHSRSMWGAMDGSKQPKYLLTRDALRAGLGKVGPQTRIGLAAFGHRRLDCSDAEMVKAPEPLDIEKLMGPLEQLTPRGTGPLTLALREAARALTGDGPRSVVLIHDDADNCQVDLCSLAAELRAVGIKAHVVGLGVKPADMAKMACLTQTTGGRHLNAQSSEQAVSLVEEVLSQAGAGSGRPVQAAAQPSPGVTASAQIPTTGPTALYLRALRAPNTEPQSDTLIWTVAAESRPEIAIFEARAADPIVPVAPGRYIVEARDGAISVKQNVEVREGRPIAVNMVLNAGPVRIQALAQKTSSQLTDALITVSGIGGPLVLATKAGEVNALLPAGRYQARAELGLTRAEQTFTVAAGKPANLDIPLNVAFLQLSTTGGNAGPEPSVLSVAEDDPDAPQGRRELARSAAQQVNFVLPPGTYYISARQGLVEARERLAIAPGEVVKRALSSAAGWLALSTKAPPASASANEQVSYRIVRLDGGPQDAVATSGAAPTVLLPSGRYRVEGSYGLMNVRIVRDIEIKAGQTQQLLLEPQVAVLRMRLAGATHGEIWWEVRDETGKGVWTASQIEPAGNLLAGRYLVRAETRDKRYERTVDLRPGDTKLLEIAPD